MSTESKRRARHRYIFCGAVKGSDQVSDFRLIRSIRECSFGSCVRVNIPDDMELCHFSGDNYSTVANFCDETTLDEVGWDCYFLYKGKWRKFNYLKQFNPCYWGNVLEYIFGLYRCGDKIGWTDSSEEHKKYWDDGMSGRVPFKSAIDRLYPPFKEDKRGIELKINLKEFYRDDCDEEWYPIYKKLVEEQKKKEDE